jgi:predicted  nucleic acid-binding Zn-ribbon protein
MSAQGYEELVLLNRKIDDLVNNFNSLKEECRNLKTRNEALNSTLREREEKMKELEKKYDRIKLSGALLGEGENATEAKRRINELMREIDKCIALLDR